MYLTTFRDIKRIGFVGTRFAGTDGVSLEADKWDIVLRELGYSTFWFSGLSDRDPATSVVYPPAFFGTPEMRALHAKFFNFAARPPELSDLVERMKDDLKRQLRAFVDRFSIDLLVVENALAIPVHIPLGLAIAEFVAETEMPTIAHNHDFVWERERFRRSCVDDWLDAAFPPSLRSIYHVVINSEARRELAWRKGIASVMIPNVHDFDAEPQGRDAYNATLRAELGVESGEVLMLQPTRVIARKGIESSIELASRMEQIGGLRVKILIAHPERDEGGEYFERIKAYAKLLDVELLLRPDLFGTERGARDDGGKRYSLWDAYACADFVTYPSTYEGFGNAFLEAVFHRKPVMVNRYAIFRQDIEPAGFSVVAIDGYLHDEAAREVLDLLADPKRVEAMTARNFELGRKYFSYDVLRRRLPFILMNFGIVS
ncbi:MAG: glycosyltransferase family 4 protein [Spirochaetales bacterium]|nr:glycosyltransferase family 4 protein [Spirochaetales bacterium]